jgi:hypothetical protein
VYREANTEAHQKVKMQKLAKNKFRTLTPMNGEENNLKNTNIIS